MKQLVIRNFARILVDLDMFHLLSEFFLVERDGYSFNVNVEYSISKWERV
jgi:hypothetical protein